MGTAARIWTVLLLGAAACGVVACEHRPQPPRDEIFTTEHQTVGDAFAEFFNRRSEPVQPIDFPHHTHIEKDLTCTDFCHESVTKGPQAGIPGVNTCMICHESIATDKPRIKTITDEYAAKGIEIPWKRVYGFTQSAHVKFNHAPHIRAKVECSTCHGDVAHENTAQRNVEHTMGFCVRCHTEHKAPNDCLTCHY